MRSVFVCFILLALVFVSHACWNTRIKRGPRCQDPVDKTWHRIGSKWTNSKCDKCSCRLNNISCCRGWPIVTPKHCTIKYNYKTCTYQLIDIWYPNRPCYAVGK